MRLTFMSDMICWNIAASAAHSFSAVGSIIRGAVVQTADVDTQNFGCQQQLLTRGRAGAQAALIHTVADLCRRHIETDWTFRTRARSKFRYCPVPSFLHRNIRKFLLPYRYSIRRRRISASPSLSSSSSSSTVVLRALQQPSRDWLTSTFVDCSTAIRIREDYKNMHSVRSAAAR